MLVLLSLILIIIENNISIEGLFVCVSLSFLTYLINMKRNFIFIAIVYFLIVSQTDRYFSIGLIVFVYVFINLILASNVEYNKRSVLYYLPLQLGTYFLLSYNFFRLEYLILNLFGLVIFNYIYTRSAEKSGLRKANEI